MCIDIEITHTIICISSDDPDGKEEIKSLPGQSRLVHSFIIKL